MNCNEVMTKDPSCCLPGDTAYDAARLMKAEDVGPVPIVNDKQTKQLLGIVTDRDLVLKVLAEGSDPKSTQIDGVMTTEVVACNPEDACDKALDLMEQHQVRRIPIVDKDNRLVGIISQADIATRLNEPEKTADVVEEISRAAA